LVAPIRPLVLLAALVACGCGSASLPSTVVVGRYPSAPPALWERSVDGLRAAGYEPVAADPARGRLAVASRARSSSYGGARFELQLYREGWVQVKVAGPVVQASGPGHVRLPADLAQEYEAFLFELARILGADPGADPETPEDPS
jgi:hypothetical protein